MKRLCTYLLILLAVLNSCTGGVEKRLVTIDSLLYRDSVDSACTLLRAMPIPDINDKENMAYYTLLKTEAFFRQGLPFNKDSIDYAIFYYEHNAAKEKLARCYYYKGMALYPTHHNADVAISFLKKAEDIASQLKDVALLHKVYESICFINLTNKNYAVGLQYAQKARALATKTRNPKWMAYCLTYMANAYYGLGMPDSNMHYLLKSLDYVKYMSDYNQAILFTNLCDAYNKRSDNETAESFVKKAMGVRPNNYTYAFFADFYTQRGEYAKANELLTKAIDTQDATIKEKALVSMSHLKAKMGDYKGALQIVDSLMELKEQQEKLLQKANILEIQNRYDREKREHRIERYKYIAIVAVSATILIIALFFFYHKYSIAKEKRELFVKRMQIGEYSEKLNDMEQSHSEAQKELSNLRQRVSNIQSRERQSLINGRALYDDIQQGGNIIHWSGQDLQDFLQYLQLIDLEFFENLEKSYRNLSSKQILFLALVNMMDKSEEEVESIFAVTAGTIRSIKSRIRSKAK